MRKIYHQPGILLRVLVTVSTTLDSPMQQSHSSALKTVRNLGVLLWLTNIHVSRFPKFLFIQLRFLNLVSLNDNSHEEQVPSSGNFMFLQVVFWPLHASCKAFRIRHWLLEEFKLSYMVWSFNPQRNEIHNLIPLGFRSCRNSLPAAVRGNSG